MKTLILILVLLASSTNIVIARPLQSQTPDTQQLFQTALEQYRAQKFDDALATCFESLKVNANDFRVHALMGYIYAAQRKLKSASESFAKALQLKPDAKELYLAKSQADQYRNAHDEALAAAQQAVKLDPNFAEAWLMVGTLLRWNKERKSEAIAAYQRVIEINPRMWQAYSDLGQIFQENKDEKGAEEVFRKGMATDPKRMAGRFALGRMLVKQGRLKEARELWEQRTSDNDNTYPQFIELLTRAENKERVTAQLAKAPNDPVALFEMGQVVMEGDSWVVDGRQKRAIEYFQKALALKPDYAQAQSAIVKAYIQIADTFGDAKKDVERELAKLRTMDSKLADEMVEYRKSYKGGIRASPVNVDQ